MTDPIADMLTRIRNANNLKKEEVILPFSKIKFEIAKILQKEGYLKQVEETGNTIKQLRLVLKYTTQREPVIQNLRKVSKPGRRIYSSYQKIPRVLDGLGIAIVSTSSGLMTNKEARKRKIGGEVICEIY